MELMTNGPLFDRMADAARRTAELRFCSDKIIPKYEQHYRDVING